VSATVTNTGSVKGTEIAQLVSPLLPFFHSSPHLTSLSFSLKTPR
jgi:hypothetical protein